MSQKKAVSLVENGYRNGLERQIGEQLKRAGADFEYEPQPPIRYTVPERLSRFTPDFILPNGIIVETVGRFITADRQKMLLIQKQHPILDIRLVFWNSRGRISKQSATTYRMWCERYGFLYADKSIPDAWLTEVLSPEKKAAALALPTQAMLNARTKAAKRGAVKK